MIKIAKSIYIISIIFLIEIVYSIYTLIQQEYIDAFGDFIDIIFVYFIFIGLILYSLVDSISNYLKIKKLIAFLPFVIALLLPILKFATDNYISNFCKDLQNSPSEFYANANKGRFGLLDFKKNGYLLVSENHHTVSVFYWGKYKRTADTISININKYEMINNLAVVHNDTLQFANDDVFYKIRKVEE